MRVFAITGTAIGFGGTLIGLVLGLVIASNAETLRSWVSEITNVPIFPPEVFSCRACRPRST